MQVKSTIKLHTVVYMDTIWMCWSSSSWPQNWIPSLSPYHWLWDFDFFLSPSFPCHSSRRKELGSRAFGSRTEREHMLIIARLDLARSSSMLRFLPCYRSFWSLHKSRLLRCLLLDYSFCLSLPASIVSQGNTGWTPGSACLSCSVHYEKLN